MSQLHVVLSDEATFFYAKGSRDITFLSSVPASESCRDILANLYRHKGYRSCRVVVDLADEDFFCETRVSAKERFSSKLLDLQLSRHFSTNAFRTVFVVKSKDKAAKKHSLICAGVEKNAAITELLHAIESVGMVYVSVVSLTLLLASVFERQRQSSRPMLLVASQTGSFIRFSVYHQQVLILSRCSLLEKSATRVLESIRDTITYYERTVSQQGESVLVVLAGAVKTLAKQSDGPLAYVARRHSVMEDEDWYRSVLRNSANTRSQCAYQTWRNNQQAVRYVVSNILALLTLGILIGAIFIAIVFFREGLDWEAETERVRNLPVSKTIDIADISIPDYLNDQEIVDVLALSMTLGSVSQQAAYKDLLVALGKALSNHTAIVLQELTWFQAHHANDLRNASILPRSTTASSETYCRATLIAASGDIASTVIAHFVSELKSHGLIVNTIKKDIEKPTENGVIEMHSQLGEETRFSLVISSSGQD